MVNFGEWNEKGETLSNVTAQKEYGISDDLINKGIESGQLEYREGSVWGSPFVRVLRRQLEKYIVNQLGVEYLANVKNKTELRAIKREKNIIKRRLAELEKRETEINKIK